MPDAIDLTKVSCPCGSGNPFAICHGKQSFVTYQKPELEPATPVLKLDLGCGQNCQEGFEGVDWIAGPGVKHVVDLSKYPWPFADGSVAEIYCSHFIEHIEAGYITVDGKPKDAFFAFFDECCRILVPGSTMKVICPNARSNRGFQDPTHRRFIVAETFAYLDAEWRKAQRLDHYNVSCNFMGVIGWTLDAETNALNDMTRQHHFNRYWNTIHDWHVTLTKKAIS